METLLRRLIVLFLSLADDQRVIKGRTVATEAFDLQLAPEGLDGLFPRWVSAFTDSTGNKRTVEMWVALDQEQIVVELNLSGRPGRIVRGSALVEITPLAEECERLLEAMFNEV